MDRLKDELTPSAGAGQDARTELRCKGGDLAVRPRRGPGVALVAEANRVRPEVQPALRSSSCGMRLPARKRRTES